jgi:hypothetical protein
MYMQVATAARETTNELRHGIGGAEKGFNWLASGLV